MQDTTTGSERQLGTEGSSGASAGGRTLGGGAVPASSSAAASSSSSARRAAPKKKFATLGDFASGGGGGGGDSSDGDDTDDHDFFAGGEKSGLAVQNPDDLKKKILEKARRYVLRRLQRILNITNIRTSTGPNLLLPTLLSQGNHISPALPAHSVVTMHQAR